MKLTRLDNIYCGNSRCIGNGSKSRNEDDTFAPSANAVRGDKRVLIFDATEHGMHASTRQSRRLQRQHAKHSSLHLSLTKYNWFPQLRIAILLLILFSLLDHHRVHGGSTDNNIGVAFLTTTATPTFSKDKKQNNRYRSNKDSLCSFNFRNNEKEIRASVDGIKNNRSDSNNSNYPSTTTQRRRILHQIVASFFVTATGLPAIADDSTNVSGSSSLSSLATSTSTSTSTVIVASSSDRRQLELCIVTMLRVLYWSESIAQDLSPPSPPTSSPPAPPVIDSDSGDTVATTGITYNSGDTTDSNTVERQEEIRKQKYLEARLGAKALVTGKVGGGANNKVYTLSTLQLKGCLKDIIEWVGTGVSSKNQAKKRVVELRDDLIESIASIVEFDGLESTTDPSPRPTLTAKMYTDQKAKFVQRILRERVIPTTREIIQLFDPEIQRACETYAKTYYSNELPLSA